LPAHASALQPKSAFVKDLSQNALRTCLVLLNVTVALRAPYFGNMLTAVGGLTDAFLCFVVPPLVYRVTLRGEISPVADVAYLLLVAWGVFIIVYTLYHVVELSIPSIIGNL
jgi:amino acid permease